MIVKSDPEIPRVDPPLSVYLENYELRISRVLFGLPHGLKLCSRLPVELFTSGCEKEKPGFSECGAAWAFKDAIAVGRPRAEGLKEERVDSDGDSKGLGLRRLVVWLRLQRRTAWNAEAAAA